MAGIWIAILEDYAAGGGEVPIGSVKFELNEELTDTTTGLIYANTQQVAPIPLSGPLVQLLLANDSPSLFPTTSQWAVFEDIEGAPGEEFWITVPSAPVGSRTVNDGIAIGGSELLVSATAAFTSADKGKYVFCPPFFGSVGLNEPALPVLITEYVNSTTVQLSANALAAGAGQLLVVGASAQLGLLRPQL